jgi:hypothetical protein
MTAKDWVLLAVAMTVLMGSTVTAVEYFAKDADLVLVAQRLEQKIQSDQMWQVQQRLWQLEDRNQARECDQYRNEADKGECRMLKLRVEILKEELSR